MKTTFTVTALTFAALFSVGASAASLVTSQEAQAQNLQSVGTISVAGIDGSPMTIRDALSQKAESQGASKYRIIEAMDSGRYHATAEIYK
ncbi:YdgH/BhsA/McbA-like domain containing protein [Pantoea sp. 1.19]|uniref:YdgH/BhsA/McbA-like domain containing protein n=1 Tax=Pantoea sp. 1.19 TaxID=1925589 RepID=UPI00094894D0|nr:YdgH/BhsA/McbA-like domain containing protein [Pantoea sp. 1.19]